MRANVRFADGTRAHCTIRRIESDGECRYGYAVIGKVQIPVSETTTIHHRDGRVTKEWDEVVLMAVEDEVGFVTDTKDEYW